MHINSDRLIEALTQVELLHIESCTQCKIERQKLMALKLSANQIDIIEPPSAIWQGLNEKKNKRASKSLLSTQWIFATAASSFFIAVAWLMLSNYRLQSQLEDVLLANKQLELQLLAEATGRNSNLEMYSEVLTIEDEISLASTQKEILTFLKQRQNAMKLIVSKYSRGEENEIISL